MFGESVIKSVTGHREVRLFWFGGPQEAANYLISFASIKIVSIDGGESITPAERTKPHDSHGFFPVWREFHTQVWILLEDVSAPACPCISAPTHPKFFLNLSSE